MSYLDYLYYKIGKQAVDFELQQQEKDGFMSKRRKYSEIGFKKDQYWLPRVNARTIMSNEIVLDLDPFPEESSDSFKERIERTKKEVLKEKPDYWGIFQSNRGVHIHLWYNKMFNWNYEKRKKCRIFFINKYGADLAKSSERVTISLEFKNHWKSGKIKEMIEGDLNGYNAGV